MAAKKLIFISQKQSRPFFLTLRNNANKLENGATDDIFCSPKVRNWYLGNYKKEGEEILRVFNRRRERRNVGS